MRERQGQLEAGDIVPTILDVEECLGERARTIFICLHGNHGKRAQHQRDNEHGNERPVIIRSPSNGEANTSE